MQGHVMLLEKDTTSVISPVFFLKGCVWGAEVLLACFAKIKS